MIWIGLGRFMNPFDQWIDKKTIPDSQSHFQFSIFFSLPWTAMCLLSYWQQTRSRWPMIRPSIKYCIPCFNLAMIHLASCGFSDWSLCDYIKALVKSAIVYLITVWHICWQISMWETLFWARRHMPLPIWIKSKWIQILAFKRSMVFFH